jgi:phosphatidylserine/phosphatidylglycerophosphate/cardiolipin synthase-like enzyme
MKALQGSEQTRERLEGRFVKGKRKSRLAPLSSKELERPGLGRSVLDPFIEPHWPVGAPRSELYYDPPQGRFPPRIFASLRAKWLVVDCERSLITSANFTGRAQAHNIEAGVFIHDKTSAERLGRQRSNSIDAGDVVRR